MGAIFFRPVISILHIHVTGQQNGRDVGERDSAV